MDHKTVKLYKKKERKEERKKGRKKERKEGRIKKEKEKLYAKRSKRNTYENIDLIKSVKYLGI